MKIIYSAQYKQTSLLGKRPLIEAIRNHPKVGNGSLTSIDEAMTDMEIAVEKTMILNYNVITNGLEKNEIT